MRVPVVNPWVEANINPRPNPAGDDKIGPEEDHGAMTFTDYLINAIFVLVVLRQARERKLDRRSIVVPLVLVFFVAQMYLHSIPTAGNDLILIGLLAAVGLTLGVASGLATHVRSGDGGLPVARVGWLAATLLIAGIGSRMVFAFAVTHGFRSDIASFSIAHHISAAAWPTALVLMAICEVTTHVGLDSEAELEARSARACSVLNLNDPGADCIPLPIEVGFVPRVRPDRGGTVVASRPRRQEAVEHQVVHGPRDGVDPQAGNASADSRASLRSCALTRLSRWA